ncbi:MAG: 3-5 exoribonuclease [Solirubrobacteraceae bacterium]|jgi:3'-5' exoribonuclease|nr:3-5 exoribonuclease [Solirubrobacteraceae bacterium]
MQQGALIDDSQLEPGKAFARELQDGQAVDSVFVVRDRARREKRNGDAYLKLRLSDVTGMVEAVVWDEVDAFHEATAPGNIVRVDGRFAVDSRYGGCITIRTVREAASHEYDGRDLHDAPPHPYQAMVADMRDLISTVQNGHLRALLESFFGDGSPEWERWREAPAAKHYHQAYRHGLLEHCLSVAQGVSALSATFPGIDRDVAVTGALLHDIGKIEAYEQAGAAIDMSDAGKLQGEIPLGYYMVRRRIEDLPGFPADVAQAVLHIILSHHGKLEHGSPVLPCTREATLVHMIDNLGGTLGSFDRIEKTLGAGECWSAYDRGISSSGYFAPRRVDAA